MKRFRSERQSKRRILFRVPPSTVRFSKTCFGEQTTAMPFRNHPGFASKPAPPPFSRCHISCKSFRMPSLVSLPRLLTAFVSSLLLEDCSSVSKNNSTDEQSANASFTLHILWKWSRKLCISGNRVKHGPNDRDARTRYAGERPVRRAQGPCFPRHFYEIHALSAADVFGGPILPSGETMKPS